MAYNSDGYIMIDFTDVDFRRTNQTIEGLFKRCVDVIGTNKFILVINANGRTPLPATCSFTNNQYVIDTVIYMFAVSSNDNLFIRRNDVPASDIIDDSSISVDKTWSSNKIDSELDTKADASALADYQPLLTPGTNITIDENNVISSTGGVVIDDSVIVNNKVWSSLNTVEMLAPIDTIVNNPAVFNTSLALPLVECSTSFTATQEGTGDPSPINVRNFVPVEDVTITANGIDNFIELDGARYGGYIDLVRKKLVLNKGTLIYDGTTTPTSVNYRPTETSVGWYYDLDLDFNIDMPTEIGVTSDANSNWLAVTDYFHIYNGSIDNCFSLFNNVTTPYKRVFVRTSDTSLTTKALIDAYLSTHPLHIVYNMATPIEISLPDIPTISTIIGANSIESDTGTIKVSYRHLPIDLI